MHWIIIHIISAFILVCVNFVFKTRLWKTGITYQDGDLMGVVGHFSFLWVIFTVVLLPIGYFFFR